MKLIKNTILFFSITVAMLLANACSSNHQPMIEATEPSAPPATYHTALWSGNTTQVWRQLIQQSSTKLHAMLQTEQSESARAWVELALIAKHDSTDTPQLARQLIVWREHNPNHPGNQLLPPNESLLRLENTNRPQHIAVLIPQQGKLAQAGQAIKEGFLNAYYAHLPKTEKQTVKFYDTAQTPHIAAVYQQALSDGADIVIGPLSKTNVQELSTVGSITAPTLALNYTDNRASAAQPFYEFGLLPEDEASQIAERAHAAGYKHALVIAPQNAWGHRLVDAFSTRWQTRGGQIQETLFFSKQGDFNREIAALLQVSPVAHDPSRRKIVNRSGLETERRQDFDVIFVFAQPQDGRAIVPLLRFYYSGNTPIYASSSISGGKNHAEKNTDLDGITVCDIPWKTRMTHTQTDAIQDDRLYAVGQDAYLLSQNLQRLRDMPHFPLYASTGALILTKQKQIHRHLPCTTIINGQT